MRGNVIKSNFLGQNQTPQNTPNPQTGITPTASPIPGTKPGVNLGQVLRSAGIIAVLGLVGLIALIFFLIKPRS